DRKVFSVSILDKLNKKTADEIYEAAKIKNVTVQRVSRDKLDDLAHGKHQGIIATVASYDYAELEDLFDLAKSRDELPFFIILAEIVDPHIVAAILRTADATCAHGIIIPKRRVVCVIQSLAKTYSGAIEHIPVVQVTKFVQTIKQ